MEIYFIAYYDTFIKNGKGFNLSYGGEGSWGRTLSEDGRKRISLANSGENNWHWGKEWSEETKKKMSESQSGENGFWFGKRMSLDAREKMSLKRRGKDNVMFGKTHTPEARKKISEKNSGENNPGFNKKTKNASSSYLGVSIHNYTQNEKKYSVWRATIKLNKKQIHIGSYKIEIEAAKAYDNYVIENNLTTRKLNFPSDYPNFIGTNQ
jgi:hypothetical protein